MALLCVFSCNKVECRCFQEPCAHSFKQEPVWLQMQEERKMQIFEQLTAALMCEPAAGRQANTSFVQWNSHFLCTLLFFFSFFCHRRPAPQTLHLRQAPKGANWEIMIGKMSINNRDVNAVGSRALLWYISLSYCTAHKSNPRREPLTALGISVSPTITFWLWAN